MSIFTKGAEVDHMGISVKLKNWDAAVEAYTEILGFKMERTWDTKIAGKESKFCFLSSPGEYPFYIELIAYPDLPEGLCEICYRVKDIEAVYDELKEKGVTLISGVRRGPLPEGKKWMDIGTKCKIAYAPPEAFKGAYPPYGIEFIEYEAPMKEVFKSKTSQTTIYGP